MPVRTVISLNRPVLKHQLGYPNELRGVVRDDNNAAGDTLSRDLHIIRTDGRSVCGKQRTEFAKGYRIFLIKRQNRISGQKKMHDIV